MKILSDYVDKYSQLMPILTGILNEPRRFLIFLNVFDDIFLEKSESNRKISEYLCCLNKERGKVLVVTDSALFKRQAGDVLGASVSLKKESPLGKIMLFVSYENELDQFLDEIVTKKNKPESSIKTSQMFKVQSPFDKRNNLFE